MAQHGRMIEGVVAEPGIGSYKGKIMCRIRLILGAIVAMWVGFVSLPACAERFNIVYPRVSATPDLRAAFALAVLDLAMKEAKADYTIEPSDQIMERGRALIELREGKTINLHWTSMASDVEQELRPVRIPIHRGLIGYRVFIIRKDRQADFDKVHNLEELKALTGGQGLGWVDSEILKNAGLNLQISTYDLLFKMVEAGRIDYYPRGVVEAFTEIDARKNSEPDLAVENHLLLLYKSDFIFFTSKHDERLAATIEKGLTAAYQDGAYMQLFNSHPYIQEAIKRSNLKNRTVIRLDNPYLSDQDRNIPEKYWMPY
jgi:hypothetical protein